MILTAVSDKIHDKNGKKVCFNQTIERWGCRYSSIHPLFIVTSTRTHRIKCTYM